MKLAVINFSGNVGKTTVARHLLAPRIPGCQVIAVESINADDGQSVTIRGRQFAQLQEFLQSVDNVVIDIGASNVEDLLKLMRRYRDSQQDFDGFIVPTVPARKQQQDTAATLTELARIGVPPDRLRLVFNQIDDDSPIERTFDTLLAYCASSGVVQPRPAAFISFNEVYALVRGTGQSLAELAADSTDYKAAIATASAQSDKLALAHRLAVQRLARGVIPELDACFEALDLHLQAHRSGEAAVPAA
jgi:MinD-like ATPase involved in chromosome partitioning or flagellar assembly